ncbi:MAG: YtxH protein [Marmoricola sp.]|nr:YtxH protein [Marmoricola sp.]
MIKKALAVTSFGAGYVLGARAGRERYEQIRRIALRVKDDPQVRQTVEDVSEFAKDQGAAAADKFMPVPFNSTATP